jgi:hypothetical protein
MTVRTKYISSARSRLPKTPDERFVPLIIAVSYMERTRRNSSFDQWRRNMPCDHYHFITDRKELRILVNTEFQRPQRIPLYVMKRIAEYQKLLDDTI